jgi:xanthine dehydrogenase accessory factor
MRHRTAPVRPVTIVLGCGDIGSAVALALHASGFSVVLVDEADPAWHRRGMAFTNAWYVGNAELDGEGACFCASLKSIPSVLVRRLIAATTWSWPGVVGALAPTVLVDARGRKRRGSEILLGRVPFTIGIGVDFVEGENVDVAIDLAADSSHGPGEEPNPLEPASRADFAAGCGADCIVEAARHGRFMTERRIGDAVRVGQIVGGLGNEAIAAPAGGVLLGLAARGARIGQTGRGRPHRRCLPLLWRRCGPASCGGECDVRALESPGPVGRGANANRAGHRRRCGPVDRRRWSTCTRSGPRPVVVGRDPVIAL